MLVQGDPRKGGRVGGVNRACKHFITISCRPNINNIKSKVEKNAHKDLYWFMSHLHLLA